MSRFDLVYFSYAASVKTKIEISFVGFLIPATESLCRFKDLYHIFSSAVVE